ncbi:MAG: hypothetical protein GY861_06470 [bacterium]|nr:hypothetical protein [bacterium]
MQPEIISETPIPTNELKVEIEKIKKRDEEPNFRVVKMDEYLASFSTLSATKSKELIAKLEKLNIPRLKDIHIYKIADLLPKSVNELKVILQGYTVTVNNENMKKIVDTIKEYATKK